VREGAILGLDLPDLVRRHTAMSRWLLRQD
jgi:hypothetical protein